MTITILKIDDIDIKNIKFCDIISKKRQKLITKDGNTIEKTIHYIDILYKDGPLYIQIDNCQLYEINNSISNVKINTNSQVLEFIKKLEEYLLQMVYKNCEQLFNGKRFTMNKIRSSFISNIKDQTLSTTLEKRGMFFNQYKHQITIEKIIENINQNKSLDSINILKLANLQFMDNYFTYNFALEQSKVYIHDYLDNYSIIESKSSIQSKSSKYDGAEYDEYYKSEDN